MIELPKGITLIAAVGQSGQLGLRNQLPWPDDKEDMKWFQQVTRMADICIAGYCTYQSLPQSVCNDRHRSIFIDKIEYSPIEFINFIKKNYSNIRHNRIAIIGGAKTYQRWMPFARTILLTKIQYDGPADTWMPKLWNEDD